MPEFLGTKCPDCVYLPAEPTLHVLFMKKSFTQEASPDPKNSNGTLNTRPSRCLNQQTSWQSSQVTYYHCTQLHPPCEKIHYNPIVHEQIIHVYKRSKASFNLKQIMNWQDYVMTSENSMVITYYYINTWLSYQPNLLMMPSLRTRFKAQVIWLFQEECH